MIVGEALNSIVRIDPEVISNITSHRKIISFRNILVHGYAIVDDRVVWDIIKKHLPELKEEVEGLLS